MNFSTGPVVLPTADGTVEVSSFSTDYRGQIVDWDMDLFLSEPRLNVDTDNVNGGIDSAGAPGESASVSGQREYGETSYPVPKPTSISPLAKWWIIPRLLVHSERLSLPYRS